MSGFSHQEDLYSKWVWENHGLAYGFHQVGNQWLGLILLIHMRLMAINEDDQEMRMVGWD